MDYFNKILYLAEVDKEDNVIGKVERWKAHKKGVLHRAFTVCLIYKGKIIFQHRKHPVFNDVFDFTCSSHPIYVKDKLQNLEDSVYETLSREWDISRVSFKGKLEHKGSIYYRSKDSSDQFQEHEVCHFYVSRIDKLPRPNLEYAYGFSLIDVDKVKSGDYSLKNPLAPWVIKLISLL